MYIKGENEERINSLLLADLVQNIDKIIFNKYI